MWCPIARVPLIQVWPSTLWVSAALFRLWLVFSAVFFSAVGESWQLNEGCWQGVGV